MTDEAARRRRLDELRMAAEDGDAEAMFLLGVAHAQGQGVTRNDVAAARWFQQAARRGHARANTSIGYLHSTGRGVRHDLILAYLFLHEAAQAGDPLASDMLARLRPTMTQAQIKEAEGRRRAQQAAGPGAPSKFKLSPSPEP